MHKTILHQLKIHVKRPRVSFCVKLWTKQHYNERKPHHISVSRGNTTCAHTIKTSNEQKKSITHTTPLQHLTNPMCVCFEFSNDLASHTFMTFKY